MIFTHPYLLYVFTLANLLSAGFCVVMGTWIIPRRRMTGWITKAGGVAFFCGSAALHLILTITALYSSDTMLADLTSDLKVIILRSVVALGIAVFVGGLYLDTEGSGPAQGRHSGIGHLIGTRSRL